jgi:hypothetical protein
LFNQASQLEQYGESGICGFAGSETNATLNQPSMGYLAAGTSYTVVHKLGLSLFSSAKLLPLRYAPLEVELTLAAPEDWLITQIVGTAYAGSTNYSISNVQIIYDAYCLDEQVQNSFYKALLSSRVLSIPNDNAPECVSDCAKFDFRIFQLSQGIFTTQSLLVDLSRHRTKIDLFYLSWYHRRSWRHACIG